MDFTALTINALKTLSNFSGGFGLGIILLTIIVKLAMHPLNISQQRSMKKMQALTPKIKDIQTKYKNNPQMMQTKMMEFYKENKFNPMGGCLPLLLQMPIFILLYTALMSPQFVQVAGDSSFLFIKRLDATLQSQASTPNDGTFGVSKFDTFSSDKTVTATYKDGETATVKVTNPRKAVEIQGELTPGDSVDLKISLDNLKLKFSELDKIKSAEVNVINNSTKEVEKLKFDRNGTILTSSINTVKSEKKTNMDVLLLILLFGVTMYISQKVMMKSQSAPMDEAQAAMQKSLGKIMPIMVTGMFVFIPIPAGVMLYLITSNIIQLLQTMVINKQLEKEMPQTPSNGVIDAEVVDKK